MIRNTTSMALTSLKRSRSRSALTIMGIVIGVASIMTIIAIGNGIHHQTKQQYQISGDNQQLLIIQSGQNPLKQSVDQFINSRLMPTASTLTDQDLAVIGHVPGVIGVTYQRAAGGLVSTANNHSYPDAVIMGVPENYLDIRHWRLARGSFFGKDETHNGAVIGQNIAQQLFGEDSPIGSIVHLRGNEFVVQGVFARVAQGPISAEPSLNDLVLISNDSAQKLAPQLAISTIFARLADNTKVDPLAKTVAEAVRLNHAGDSDFYVISAGQLSTRNLQWISMITNSVTAIAGIALFVGGIGIMNIMLVSVSERTKEIGIRKAVGATNRQILWQFLIESTLLSLIGGLVGLLVCLLACLVIRLVTPLEPILNIFSAGQAIGISVVVGIVFGTTPAIQAASKDPIIALRHHS